MLKLLPLGAHLHPVKLAVGIRVGEHVAVRIREQYVRAEAFRAKGT
jgi:hypothetical protein